MNVSFAGHLIAVQKWLWRALWCVAWTIISSCTLKKRFFALWKKRFFAPSTKRIFKRNESLFHLNEIIWLMHNTFDQIFDLPTINLKIRQFYYGCISDPFIINFRFKMNQISQVYSHVSYRSTDSINFHIYRSLTNFTFIFFFGMFLNTFCCSFNCVPLRSKPKLQ